MPKNFFDFLRGAVSALDQRAGQTSGQGLTDFAVTSDAVAAGGRAVRSTASSGSSGGTDGGYGGYGSGR